MNNTAQVLRQVAGDTEMMWDVGRKAVEDALILLRDSRISVWRNNGLVVRERHGADSSVIRMGIEEAVRIAMLAMADHLESQEADQ